jgi:hypothetical protein
MNDLVIGFAFFVILLAPVIVASHWLRKSGDL